MKKSGNSQSVWFDVIEKDEKHDLALCKLMGVPLLKESTFLKTTGFRPDSLKRASSTEVAAYLPVAGEEIALMGFPLGSFITPVIQFGNIGATNAVLDAVPHFPAGNHNLLIVSVPGNHGDSGGPIISMNTGQVIGMLIQYVPAPLVPQIPQQSGLMVAIPAQWIMQIMERHGVKNEPIKLSEHLAW